MYCKIYSSGFQCAFIYKNQAKRRRLTVALNCWSLYFGSILRRKWASTVSKNLVLAVSFTKVIAVFKSYSLLISLNFWISKNLLDLTWWHIETTINLKINGENIMSAMKNSVTQTINLILQGNNWLSYNFLYHHNRKTLMKHVNAK